MNPIFKTLVFPVLKKLINYSFLKLEDYAIDKLFEIMDKNEDNNLSKQELKEYRTMVSYAKKFKYSIKSN